jgi:hypothetical protein
VLLPPTVPPLLVLLKPHDLDPAATLTLGRGGGGGAHHAPPLLLLVQLVVQLDETARALALRGLDREQPPRRAVPLCQLLMRRLHLAEKRPGGSRTHEG